MTPVLLLAAVLAVGVYPGGLSLMVPAGIVRMARGKATAGTPLIGIHTIIVLGSLAVAASQIPLPGNPLDAPSIATAGGGPDILLFVVGGACALAATVRRRWGTWEMVAALSLGASWLVVALGASTVEAPTILTAPLPHGLAVRQLLLIVTLLAVPPIARTANSRTSLLVPSALSVVGLEAAVALAGVLARPTAAGWVALVAGAACYGILAVAVLRRSLAAARLCSLASALAAAALLILAT